MATTYKTRGERPGDDHHTRSQRFRRRAVHQRVFNQVRECPSPGEKSVIRGPILGVWSDANVFIKHQMIGAETANLDSESSTPHAPAGGHHAIHTHGYGAY